MNGVLCTGVKGGYWKRCKYDERDTNWGDEVFNGFVVLRKASIRYGSENCFASCSYPGCLNVVGLAGGSYFYMASMLCTLAYYSRVSIT